MKDNIISSDDFYKRFFPSDPKRALKVCKLEDAVQKLIQPGMTMHVMSMHCRPNAVFYEIFRQFNNRNPAFTFIVTFMIGPGVILFYKGMVKKVITTFLGDSHPFPGPNRVYLDLLKKNEIQIENWSVLSLNQRLMAAAMGVEFIPTRSLLGSTMAIQNKESFARIRNPFDSGNEVSVVKALKPDVSVVHGLAADCYGNTILMPPFGEDIYGALASRQGALVTVEKIVSTEVIRKYSHLVRLPSHLVSAVCEVPLGAHPNGINNQNIAEVENYSDDIDFFIDVRNAAKSDESLDRWIRDWVVDCKNQRQYLRKLGFNRINTLKGKTQADSWNYELDCLIDDKFMSKPATDAERMVLVSAQTAIEKIQKFKYELVLAGAGLSNLAAWMVHHLLKTRGMNEIDLISEWGYGGYHPQPGNPFLFNDANSRTCRFMSDVFITLGSFLKLDGARRSLAMLGGAQIDKLGNINSTLIPPDSYVTGSGGANDVASGANEIIVTIHQSKGRFVDSVPYITSPGSRVTTVVSQLGVFEKPAGQGELVLTGYFESSSDKEVAIQEIKNKCGWGLKVSPDAKPIPFPSKKDIQLLRVFDPRGYFINS
jgi:acyl CoA:acetate/3-ketoacid CoA transferase beta subunit/acyl CoA:acetate/3-ketoacid CoA transferase alpha subunit